MALERFRIIQPHLEHDRSLSLIARTTNIPYRTMHLPESVGFAVEAKVGLGLPQFGKIPHCSKANNYLTLSAKRDYEPKFRTSAVGLG